MTIRVLIVDDSAVMRQILRDALEIEGQVEVVGIARDGFEALDKIHKLQPDLVTLDVKMPRMDGLATLKRILDNPLPVIMVSSFTVDEADTTLQALDLGAMDYVSKPKNIQRNAESFRDELVSKVRRVARMDVPRVLRMRRANTRQIAESKRPKLPNQVASLSTIDHDFDGSCIALGISTGGPPALNTLLEAISLPLPPLVIVQHMPANFTHAFAKRLNTVSQLEVVEAADGDLLACNRAYIAPGGRHLRLERRGGNVRLRVFDDEPVNRHRPSVNVMMESAATAFGDRCIGVIMTGMGDDGADGCVAIRNAGGFVLGQDRESSDVYGMNKVAYTQGGVNQQFSLPELPQLLATQARRRLSRASLQVAAAQGDQS